MPAQLSTTLTEFSKNGDCHKRKARRQTYLILAGPCSTSQFTPSGGPYVTCSQVLQHHDRWRSQQLHGIAATMQLPARRCPLAHFSGGRIIHSPLTPSTMSPTSCMHPDIYRSVPTRWLVAS